MKKRVEETSSRRIFLPNSTMFGVKSSKRILSLTRFSFPLSSSSSPFFPCFFTPLCPPLTGAHSILDQALPDDSITDRQAKNNSNAGGPFSNNRRGVPDEVYLARSLRKLARKLKHGGHDLNKFRNQIDMSKKDLRMAHSILKVKKSTR